MGLLPGSSMLIGLRLFSDSNNNFPAAPFFVQGIMATAFGIIFFANTWAKLPIQTEHEGTKAQRHEVFLFHSKGLKHKDTKTHRGTKFFCKTRLLAIGKLFNLLNVLNPLMIGEISFE